MASPFSILTAVGGMVRDYGRAELPPGAVWNLADFIPGLDAPLRGRGGWVAGSTFAGRWIWAVLNAEFSAGSKLCTIIDSSPNPTLNAAGVLVGNAISTYGMFFHRDRLIIPARDGTTVPMGYDGTTLGNLAGSPPSGIYGCAYKDRSVLANASGNTQRVWFSAPGDPQTWDTSTTGFWFDMTGAVVGLAPLRNALLSFHSGYTELLRGDPPPNSTFVRETIFPDVGCVDSRSITSWQDQAIWADAKGVYQSDGAAIIDLTAKGGIKSYWASQLQSYTSSWIVAAGIFRNHYIVSITKGHSSGSTSLVDTLVCDLLNRTWYRFSNFPFGSFAQVGSHASEELYGGLINAPQLGQISGCWSMAVPNVDGNGTDIQPVLETAGFRGFTRFHRRWVPSYGIQNWRRLYVTYDLWGVPASTFTVSYTTEMVRGVYTALTPTLGATTLNTPEVTRSRLQINRPAATIAFKIAQTTGSNDVRIYALEAEYAPRESSRLS